MTQASAAKIVELIFSLTFISLCGLCLFGFGRWGILVIFAGIFGGYLFITIVDKAIGYKC